MGETFNTAAGKAQSSKQCERWKESVSSLSNVISVSCVNSVNSLKRSATSIPDGIFVDHHRK